MHNLNPSIYNAKQRQLSAKIVTLERNLQVAKDYILALKSEISKLFADESIPRHVRDRLLSSFHMPAPPDPSFQDGAKAGIRRIVN